MKDLNTKEHLKPVDDEVIYACQKIYYLLNDDDIDRDGAKEVVDGIKLSSPNKSVKIVLKIISSMLFKLVDNRKTNNQTQGEATLIIENIRPSLSHCIISQLEGVKYEWQVQKYDPTLPSDGQIMIPDLTPFVEINSTTNYELFFVKVKRKGKYQNNHLANDLVKLGKEMHTALNKLVKKRTLRRNKGKSLQFNFTRDNTDNILLISAIIEKLSQKKEIVLATISNLYQCINGDEELVDLASYTRQA
ncbi:hypothetical protein G6F56_003288 [Rhizopus delemar]|nr:hypothetical protein G6F56_003288 [Rhizopus delemar]